MATPRSKSTATPRATPRSKATATPRTAGEGAAPHFPLDTAVLMAQALLQRKYNYRRRLPHYQNDDRALFVTFRAWAKEVLPETVRDAVLRHCLHDQGTKAGIHAAVVMPDHVHLLLTPLRDADGYMYSLVEILQGIKSASAHSVNRLLGEVRASVAG